MMFATHTKKGPPGEKPDDPRLLVETMGIEPTTSGLQSPRSPN